MIRTLLITSVTIVSMATTALSQDDADAPAIPGSKHSLVEVVLKNGAAFRGVALDNRLVERPVRADFAAVADDRRDARGAGIRIWYYQDLEGFLFLRYKQIERVAIIRRLGPAEVRRMRDKARAARKRIEAARVAERNQEAAEKAAADPLAALSEDERALLERFPPDAGWSQAKYEAIQKRRVVEGVEPSELEREWCSVYPDWLRAWRRSNGEKNETAEAKKVAKSGKAPANPAHAADAARSAKKRSATKKGASSRGAVETKKGLVVPKVDRPDVAKGKRPTLSRGR